MQQQISVITLGITDLARSMRFYREGFGWQPVFVNEEIAFYQMNGFILGTFLEASLAADMTRDGLRRPGAFSLAHNMPSEADVDAAMTRLVAAGGRVLRPADHPRMAGIAAMSRIPTTTHGRSPGTPPGRSTSAAW